ncbi:hypothetical protein COOONC_03561 [Cooperia oncophora]
MNTLADYGDESDEESPRRRSFNMDRSNGLGEVPAPTISYANEEESPRAHESPKAQQTDSDHSPPQRRDSDVFDDDMMFGEPRRYASFSDTSDRSETTEFREPPPPKRKEFHSPSPSLPYAFFKNASTDRDAEDAQSPSSPPSGMVEPRPPERVSQSRKVGFNSRCDSQFSESFQKSDTDDENERLIDMALEEGRNALKQVEDGASTGSGGWTPRPYDSPLHGMDLDTDTKPMDTPPHQDVCIPPAPTAECDPELVVC